MGSNPILSANTARASSGALVVLMRISHSDPQKAAEGGFSAAAHPLCERSSFVSRRRRVPNPTPCATAERYALLFVFARAAGLLALFCLRKTSWQKNILWLESSAFCGNERNAMPRDPYCRGGFNGAL